MRVTVHRSESLSREALGVVRAADVARLLRSCGDSLNVPSRSGLALRLTDDAELRRLNAAHAGIDAATDVLAFAGAGDWVGDIAVSVERARAQNPQAPVEEVRLLAVHGLLHCLGHDHNQPAPAAEMTAATRRLLPGQAVPDLEIH